MVELRVYSCGAVESIPIYVYLALIAILYIAAIFFLWLKGWKEGLRYSAVILFGEWIFLVLGTCVIFRENSKDYHFNLIPLISYFDYGENSYFMEAAALNILNVALFIPVGFLLGYGFHNLTWKRALAIGAMLSVFIEILQLVFRRGLCEVDDVIHNTAGCMIGYIIYWLLSKMTLKYLE